MRLQKGMKNTELKKKPVLKIKKQQINLNQIYIVSYRQLQSVVLDCKNEK